MVIRDTDELILALMDSTLPPNCTQLGNLIATGALVLIAKVNWAHIVEFYYGCKKEEP